MREIIHGVQVSAPFRNVKYALEVFDALEGFGSVPDEIAKANIN